MAEEEDNLEEDQAEDAEGEGAEEDGEGSKKKGKSKLFIIIGLAVLLVGGAAAAAFFFLPKGGDEEGENAQQEEGEKPGETQLFHYESPEIVTNLQAPEGGGASHFLKLKLYFAINSEAEAVNLEQVIPKIVDEFQIFLRSLRYEDLQGSAGTYRLKEGLLLRARQAAEPVEVKDILFKEILIR